MEFYWLLVLHLVGDYLLQSDWMAQQKTSRTFPALAHAAVYTAPFWLLMPSWWALTIVGGTHFVIDRWRLARYVCWAKNFLAPYGTLGPVIPSSEMRQGPLYRTGVWGDSSSSWAREITRWVHPWSECSGTGYHKDRPAWLAVWLLIIADNTMHLAFNGLALALFLSGRL